MITILILITTISAIMIITGIFIDEDIIGLSGLVLLIFTTFFGWILLGNMVHIKNDITYITLKSVKDSSTYNSIVIYKDQIIKDDSYLLFIQDSMTIKEVLSYNMYGTLINISYKPIIK